MPGRLHAVIGIRNSGPARRGVVVLTALLATTGVACGGGDDAANPTATEQAREATTTIPTYGVEQARAALSGVMDMPEGYTVDEQCLTPEDVQFHDSCSDSEAEVARFWSSNEEESALAVSVLVFADPDAAAGRFDEWHADDVVYDGAFDIPAEDLGDGDWVNGRRGEGTVEETEVGGWSGYTGVRAYDLLDREGEVMRRLTEAKATLLRGNVAVQVLVDDAEGGTREAAVATLDDRVRRLVEAFG
jgi:hypothetical protein